MASEIKKYGQENLSSDDVIWSEHEYVAQQEGITENVAMHIKLCFYWLIASLL